ncbi:unnamed protein product [Adineta ricciae]|uniref:Uncharacterized protein n=1 Tax=Adineta ricciae TaxID=249248 RepID=A0A815L677_ADIRI|nr:unnamed protein product [Adineta ricciae]
MEYFVSAYENDYLIDRMNEIYLQELNIENIRRKFHSVKFRFSYTCCFSLFYTTCRFISKDNANRDKIEHVRLLNKRLHRFLAETAGKLNGILHLCQSEEKITKIIFASE